MSRNVFGVALRLATFGESHGDAIGAILDGCPAGIAFRKSEINLALKKRRPGNSEFVSQRRETDHVRILSGVAQAKHLEVDAKGKSLNALAKNVPPPEDKNDPTLITLGSPVCLVIDNVDKRSKDYDNLRDVWRPGHADFAYDAKYGLRDHRGGGRSSARETAARVAAAALAQKIIPEIRVRAALVQLADLPVNRKRWKWSEVQRNPFFCPDPEMVEPWSERLRTLRKNRSSCGAIVEIRASNVPAGLGEPVYGKLDQDLAAAWMSINAVKGVEIGDGFAAAALTGEDAADEMKMTEGGKIKFFTNRAGGILGGISTGQDVVGRFAVKPTSSIPRPRRAVTRQGKNTEVVVGGRHDPCVGIRAVPVAEAMTVLVLADHALRHRPPESPPRKRSGPKR